MCGTQVDLGAGFLLRGRRLWDQWIGSLAWRCVQPDRRLQSKENVDLLHEVRYIDANRHMLRKLDKQAISPYFVSAYKVFVVNYFR